MAPAVLKSQAESYQLTLTKGSIKNLLMLTNTKRYENIPLQRNSQSQGLTPSRLFTGLPGTIPLEGYVAVNGALGFHAPWVPYRPAAIRFVNRAVNI